jgi:hypothetical protein
MRWLTLFSFIIVVMSAEVRASPDVYAPVVTSVVRQTIAEVFLNIFNAQTQFRNTYELIQNSFVNPVQLSNKKETALKNLKAPTIYLVKNGIVFEYEKNLGFKISVDDSGQIVDQDLKLVSSFKIPLNLSFSLSTASAQGWEEAMAIEGLIVLARTVIVPLVTRLAIEAAVGASVGCGIGIAWTSGEKRIKQACLDGAKEGALALVGGAKLIKLAKGGSVIARIALGTGLSGMIVLVGYNIKDLGTMNASILRCNGIDGDFTLSARLQGVTGSTLYEAEGNRLVFYMFEKGKIKEVPVDKDVTSLEKFFARYNIFPGASKLAVDERTNKVISEISAFNAECKSNKEGHSRKLWSSEGENIQKSNVAPAAR